MNFLTSAIRHNASINYRQTIAITNIKASRGRFFATSPEQDTLSEQKDPLSQGHANDPTSKHKKDTQSQSVQGGKQARSSDNEGLDAASPNVKPKPSNTGSGNPEGIGMVDQVGSTGGSAQHFEKGGKQGEK
ncbi:hypothetical protein B0H34DRAFT_732734 [Crassisporium funariophilum]|nr:hypothetical protein B0H34DRAFT_732734 [Crassisporium funariophilum]